MRNTSGKKTTKVTPAAEGLSFDWTALSKQYKNNPAGLDAFISDAKNKIALMLITAAKKRKLIPDLLRKCASQNSINRIVFNEEEIWGEVYQVIATMLQRWEKYCRERIIKNKKINHASMEGELRMNTESDLIGYFRCSLKNAFADLYTKHNAQKRSANEITFSSMFPKSDDENERSFEETIACSRTSPVLYNNYKKDMIKCLREYDKKHGTKLGLIFVAMLNPRYNGAVTVIQNRLKINNKMFNDSKNLIGKILSKEFSDVAGEIIEHIDSKRGIFEDLEIGNKMSRQSKYKKQQQALANSVINPRRMNVVYGQKKHPTQANKWIYYVSVTVDESKTQKVIAYSPDNWTRIYDKEESVVGKADQMDKIRPKLEKAIKRALTEAKKLADAGGRSSDTAVAA